MSRRMVHRIITDRNIWAMDDRSSVAYSAVALTSYVKGFCVFLLRDPPLLAYLVKYLYAYPLSMIGDASTFLLHDKSWKLKCILTYRSTDSALRLILPRPPTGISAAAKQ